MSDLVLLDRPRPGVALLTLNRPDKKNALSVALREHACEVLDELAGDESLAAVVVTGAGDTFSAGFDLREFEQARDDEALAERLWASSDRWHRAWLDFPVATVAAVNGPAIAGGFDLAVMCDLRVVATAARFSHPEVSFGDVVYGPLHELVGGSLARDLVLTGRTIEADEALRAGLANRLVPDHQVTGRALELAGAVTAAPADVLRRTKAKIRRRSRTGESGTLEL